MKFFRLVVNSRRESLSSCYYCYNYCYCELFEHCIVVRRVTKHDQKVFDRNEVSNFRVPLYKIIFYLRIDSFNR